MPFSDSDDSDDDQPIAALGGAAAAASDSEPDWVKGFVPQQVPREGTSPVDSSMSDSDAGDDSDDENKPLLDFMKPADSESEGAGSDTASGPKTKRKKVAGVPSVVPLTLPAKSKLKTANLLLQVEDEELDLSGDTGAVGRFEASRKKVELDMKGVTYAGSMVKCHTLWTVLVNDGKAEIKEVFGSYVHLAQTADVREREEMEGGEFDDFDDFDVDGSDSEGEGGAKKGGKKGGGKKGAKAAAKGGKKAPPKKVSSTHRTRLVLAPSYPANHHRTRTHSLLTRPQWRRDSEPQAALLAEQRRRRQRTRADRRSGCQRAWPICRPEGRQSTLYLTALSTLLMALLARSLTHYPAVPRCPPHLPPAQSPGTFAHADQSLSDSTPFPPEASRPSPLHAAGPAV